MIETAATLLTPFAAYLICEAVHCSGVLAVVCAGLMVRQSSRRSFSEATRLHATAVWESVVFVITGLSFIFIGLEIREVVQNLATGEQFLSDSLGATAILFVTIAVRLVWVFPAAWLPRFLSNRLRQKDPSPHGSIYF